MKLFFNKYLRVARLYPSVITTLPIIIFIFYMTNTELNIYLRGLLSLKIASDVSLALILLYLFSHIIRFIGKEFYEKRIFKDELMMPITELFDLTPFFRTQS